MGQRVWRWPWASEQGFGSVQWDVPSQERGGQLLSGPPTSVSPHSLPQQGARVFGALGPIGPSSPGLALGGLAVGEHRLSNKLLAWSGVLEWQEVSGPQRVPIEPWGLRAGPWGSFCPCRWGEAWAPGLCPVTPPAPATEAQTLLGFHREAEAGTPLPGLCQPGREPVSGGQGCRVGWPGRALP